MMGYSDWRTKSPHSASTNGLRLLHHYSLEEANTMMTHPNWTRAIFVREPKERFLSAFLEKAHSHHGQTVYLEHVVRKSKTCCQHGSQEPCPQLERAKQSFTGFVRLVQLGCEDPHWRPQHYKMEDKYWPYITFVGHLETANIDAKILLQIIGAWEEFGQTGWGPDAQHDHGIFQSPPDTKAVGQHHATNARTKLLQWYTPKIELLVEEIFQVDYNNPKINYTMIRLFQESAYHNITSTQRTTPPPP